MAGAIVVGIVGLSVAGFVLFMVTGPFLVGRYSPPDDRRRENRHKVRRQISAPERR